MFAELIKKVDEDEISENEFLDVLSQAVGRRVSASDIHNQNRMPDEAIINLTQELKHSYSVNLLSNASTKLRAKLGALHLSSLFDHILISSEIGHAKPSNEAFMTAIRTLGVQPHEIIFIDDNPQNIEAARNNGIIAIPYKTISQLNQELGSLGII